MTPIYLSADTPRWVPRTEADLQAGIAQGLLCESHYLDLKEAPATRGDNKEAARDLVSFAVDSGTLIYGIAEDKVNRTFTLAPQPLNGLAEKIENIALSSLVDPQLVVNMEKVEFLDSTGLGVLVGGLKRVRAHGGSLDLVCTQGRILKIFRITGLTKVFGIHETVDQAIAAKKAEK
jgi:anti-anti-sigma factor